MKTTLISLHEKNQNSSNKDIDDPPPRTVVSQRIACGNSSTSVVGPLTTKRKNENKMKTTTLKAAAAVGLTALLLGSAAAQSSTSKPVGYETVSYTAGFNYLGIRLHEAPAASGASEAVNAAVVTVPAGVTDGLTAGTTYLFEVTSGDALGLIVTFTTFDATTITLDEDISQDFELDQTFVIRPSATLASVFGASNDQANSGEGLQSTGAFSGSDQIWVPDGLGSFAKYAFLAADPFSGSLEGWFDIAGNSVDSASINLVYNDGVIVNAAVAGELVVSGSVKLEPVQVPLTAQFNYAGSIFPVGLTLAESELEFSFQSSGAFSGADQLWVPDGSGGFRKFAYLDADPFASIPEGWQDSNGPVVASDISLDGSPGVIIFRASSEDKFVRIDSPDFYDSL